MHILNNNNYNSSNLFELEKKININADILYNEPMSRHTAFKIGGPADVFVSPLNTKELVKIYSYCINNKIPYFIHGEGSNILVSDKGIRGIVINTSKVNEINIDDNIVTAETGMGMSRLAAKTAETGLEGIENFYYMPGTLGGAVWINARCYGVSISDSLLFTDIINENLKEERVHFDKKQFDYKKSPFQNSKSLILNAGFKLKKADSAGLPKKITEYRNDRFTKGHFDMPCAGSVFKNNRDFGMPTGKIIDLLGLKGTSIGRAEILTKHGNIIVNLGGAKAEDVIKLIKLMKQKVKDKYGFNLEEEILYVGDFS
jgi:UDP-N-acetylmuramate dehydrogenase